MRFFRAGLFLRPKQMVTVFELQMDKTFDTHARRRNIEGNKLIKFEKKNW